MTQEDKQILIKVLCAGLPYEEKVEVCIKDKDIKSIDCVKYNTVSTYIGLLNEEKFSVKPYLRPMSSMTEKEFYELCELGVSLPPFKDYYGQMQYYGSGGEWSVVDVEIEDIIKYVNYLNAHHFDYNGLIEKGLALEAPEGMYNGF